MSLINKLIVLLSFTSISKAWPQAVTQQNILQGIVPQNPDAIRTGEVILDRVILNDFAYSESRKTELGDQTGLNMAFRYHPDDTSFARLRFITDPQEDRTDNETSRFELIFSKRYKGLTFQLDLELNTDNNGNGGTSLGFDLNSDDTFLSYSFANNFSLTFFPFNFRGDVGDEFNTRDINRISYIEGSPSAILNSPTAQESIVTKSIPGIELMYSKGHFSTYIGAGIATYQYPAAANFNIENNAVTDAWERRQTTAVKAGIMYTDNKTKKINLQHVSHNKADETGSLLESATSLSTFLQTKSGWVMEWETTMSQAGDAPYNLSRSSGWFVDQTPFLPIFSDYYGERQDWIGKTDFAHSFKLGFNFEDITPYISLKYLGKNFVYSNFDGTRYSAHLLRTNDDSLSHGGLTRIGLGSYFYYENFYFRPLLEWQQAKNPVFSNSTDVRQDRFLSSFDRHDIVLTVELTYTFDGGNKNQNWWF